MSPRGRRACLSFVLLLSGLAGCGPDPEPTAGPQPLSPAPYGPMAPAGPWGAPQMPYPAAPPAPPPVSPQTPFPPAPPGAPPCESLTECEACTSRPDCRLCTYMRGCLSAASIEKGVCLASLLDSPARCSEDPVRLRAASLSREAATRRAALLASTAGLAPSGAPVSARLETLSTIQFPVPAGHCHALQWILAPDARVGDVRLSISHVTPRSSDGGLTAFDTDAGVGVAGIKCSSQPSQVRFKVVDRLTYGPVTSAGTGGITFQLFVRPRVAGDPDDVGAPGAVPRGGSVGVDCLDCTFPCQSDKTACERDCFRSGLSSLEKQICNRTCEQIYRSCLRGCRGC